MILGILENLMFLVKRISPKNKETGKKKKKKATQVAKSIIYLLYLQYIRFYLET